MTFMVGFAFVVFGHWGLHTRPGQQMFPEMAGMIPAFVQIAGYILLAVALVLPLVLSFFFKGSRRGDNASSSASSYWRKAQDYLPSWFVALFVLFHVLCASTVGVHGLTVAFFWLESTPLTWVSLAVLVIASLVGFALFIDFVKIFYAARWGWETELLFLGQDLENNQILLSRTGSEKNIQRVPGSLYDQGNWFFDRFSDLECRTVNRFGSEPKDVIVADELSSKRIIMFAFMQIVLGGVLFLIALSALGTYLEAEGKTRFVIEPAESSFVTALSWLTTAFPLTVFTVALMLTACLFLLLHLAARTQKNLLGRFRSKTVEKLPTFVTSGERILGEIIEYSVEQTHSEAGKNSKRSHHNLLVKFKCIWDVPVFLRLSLPENGTTRTWLKRIDHGLPFGEQFIIQNDLSIWPHDLSIDQDR